MTQTKSEAKEVASNSEILFRFFGYFKPWSIMRLFILDLVCASIIGGVSVGLPYLAQWITTNAINSDYYPLFVGIGLLATIILIQIVASWVVTYWGHLMGIKMEINMRRDIVKKMHRLRMSVYDSTPPGVFTSDIVSNLRDIPEFAHHAPEDFLVAIIVAIGGLSYAFLQSPILGAVFLAVLIIGTVVIFFVRRKWWKIWFQVKANNAEVTGVVARQVEGISEIKSFVANNHETSLLSGLQNRYWSINHRFYRYEGFSVVVSLFITFSSTFVATAISAIFVANRDISVAQMIGLTTAATIINQPITRFVAVYSMLSRGRAAIRRFYDIMNWPEEENQGEVIKRIKGKIEFRNVNFSFKNEEGVTIQVLNDFNLVVNPKESVALVGETGIGKSTILKLLLRFYEIDSGQILIDDVDIHEYNINILRSQISYIQQAPVIFDDSIENNVLYGRPTATKNEVLQAMRSSYVEDFATKLPSGLDTMVGPRGARLSGGQRQRISIARAILSSAPVLLLDEATSALDNETEAKIKNSLESIIANSTTIVVAHRLSTIRNVNRIVVLARGGRTIETGTFDELINRPGSHLNFLNNVV